MKKVELYVAEGTELNLGQILDYLHGLPDEVSLVWPDRWSAMKVTFLLNRYIPPLSIVAAVAFEFASLHTSEKSWFCHTKRCCPLYDSSLGSRLTAAFLILFWLSIHISVFGNWLKAADIYEFISNPIEGVYCLPKPIETTIFLCLPFLLILLEQLVVMLLCLYFGLSKFWFSKNRLTRTFSRDGAYYFIVFSIVSIFNVVFSIIFRGQKHHYLSTLQGVIHTILSNQLVLHLRKKAREDISISLRASRFLGENSPEISARIRHGGKMMARRHPGHPESKPRAADLLPQSSNPVATQILLGSMRFCRKFQLR
ncbi:hypothetical protein CC2G_005103 [Coprinopsis cinerea AmutBmut pab1-1]|nr:hypothetical protein CC2G_005103 [Coprinopsis cinerea AmutBmut pab1-1]